MMNFQAYGLAVEMLESVRDAIAALRARNGDLAGQMERAATSVLLNLAEGRRRAGKDRMHLWRIADGSNSEVRAALDAAVALGQINGALAEKPRALLDRMSAMLWRLTHPR